MRPWATMQSGRVLCGGWAAPSLWEGGRETEILLAIAQLILVVWWRATIHSHYFFFINTDTHTHTLRQDKVTLHLCCNSALTKSQIHCPELYPVITLYVILCNWMPVDLNCCCYQTWYQSCLIIRRCLIHLGYCKDTEWVTVANIISYFLSLSMGYWIRNEQRGQVGKIDERSRK